MVSVVAGGLFNAVAFAGAGYLFSTFNKSGFQEEVKRHNLAMEKLTQAKEKFYQEEVKRGEKQRRLQSEIRTAKLSMMDTTKAFKELHQILRERRKLVEPQLSDFYHPSDEMEDFEVLTMTIAGSGIGWLLLTFIA